MGDDRFRGRHAWVDAAGHAARDPEVARDLYALAAGRWAAEGARLHVALVPALPELVDPWLRLGFAYVQAHAIRASGGGRAGAAPAAVAVRRGTAADLPAARPLLPLIWEHQRAAPTFTGMSLPDADEVLADWEETLAEPGSTWLVAERGGQIVGHLLLAVEEPSLLAPPGSAYLAVAATLPEERGRGVGATLAARALSWAREAGFATVHTDWRVANLEASRFWPRRGFRETFHRLARQVGIG